MWFTGINELIARWVNSYGYLYPSHSSVQCSAVTTDKTCVKGCFLFYHVLVHIYVGSMLLIYCRHPPPLPRCGSCCLHVLHLSLAYIHRTRRLGYLSFAYIALAVRRHRTYLLLITLRLLKGLYGNNLHENANAAWQSRCTLRLFGSHLHTNSHIPV